MTTLTTMARIIVAAVALQLCWPTVSAALASTDHTIAALLAALRNDGSDRNGLNPR